MFGVSINSPMTVSSIGKCKNGNYYIICRECDNQEGAEVPSANKFPVKMFVEELPDGEIVTGSKICFSTILGFEIRHERAKDGEIPLFNKYGAPMYQDSIVLQVSGLSVYPPEEGKKKVTSKKANTTS